MPEVRGRLSNPQRAVALACVGADSIREARGTGSLRALGRLTDMPASVIADIEDCSILPSDSQLRELAKQLQSVRIDLFEDARRWAKIPWKEAVSEVVEQQLGLRTDDIAEVLSAASSECGVDFVRWRLKRQLARLESLGALTQSTDGTWTVPRMAESPARGRSHISRSPWRSAVVEVRSDPDQDAFFHLESEPGQCRIVLNRSHPHYSLLHDTLTIHDVDGLDEEQIRNLLAGAVKLVRQLVVAWAEYEDAEKAGVRQDRVREARRTWGRHAKRVAAGDEKCMAVTFLP